jgi:hypothetical protein
MPVTGCFYVSMLMSSAQRDSSLSQNANSVPLRYGKAGSIRGKNGKKRTATAEILSQHTTMVVAGNTGKKIIPLPL